MFNIKNTSNGIAIENAERGFRIDFSPSKKCGVCCFGGFAIPFSENELAGELEKLYNWTLDGEYSLRNRGQICLMPPDKKGEFYREIDFNRVPSTIKGVFGTIKLVNNRPPSIKEALWDVESIPEATLTVYDEDVSVLREFLEEAIYRANGSPKALCDAEIQAIIVAFKGDAPRAEANNAH